MFGGIKTFRSNNTFLLWSILGSTERLGLVYNVILCPGSIYQGCDIGPNLTKMLNILILCYLWKASESMKFRQYILKK